MRPDLRPGSWWSVITGSNACGTASDEQHPTDAHIVRGMSVETNRLRLQLREWRFSAARTRYEIRGLMCGVVIYILVVSSSLPEPERRSVLRLGSKSLASVTQS
jgi:hypothetical protein